MKRGTIANINQEIDYELASEIAETYDVLVEPEEEKDVIQNLQSYLKVQRRIFAEAA